MQEKTEKVPVLVLGVGNILLKDEGVGVRVVEALQRESLPPGVEVMDGGTLGLDLMAPISRAEKLVVVDVVKGGGEPGAIYRFHAEDIDVKEAPINSLHQVGLYEVFRLVKQLGSAPREIVIIGVEPKEIDWGLELSPEIQAKLDKVLALVKQEIGMKT